MSPIDPLKCRGALSYFRLARTYIDKEEIPFYKVSRLSHKVISTISSNTFLSLKFIFNSCSFLTHALYAFSL